MVSQSAKASQFGRRLVVHGFELRLQGIVLHVLDGLDEIVGQEIRVALGDVERQFDEWLGQDLRQILAGGGEKRRHLAFRGDDAAQPVGQRSEVALEVGVDIQCLRVGHRVAVVGALVLQLQEVVIDPEAQQFVVERGRGAQLRGIDGVPGAS